MKSQAGSRVRSNRPKEKHSEGPLWMMSSVPPISPRRDFNDFSDTLNGSPEGIMDVSCPAVICMDSARSNYSAALLQHTSVVNSSGRPLSATRSVSNEDIHGRILLTIRMIEEEQERERRRVEECKKNLRPQISPERPSTESPRTSSRLDVGSSRHEPPPVPSSLNPVKLPQKEKVFPASFYDGKDEKALSKVEQPQQAHPNAAKIAVDHSSGTGASLMFTTEKAK